MQAYEARQAGYFGTPAVNLVWALNVSLGQILAEGMDARVARHVTLSRACQAAIAALGLGQVPLRADDRCPHHDGAPLPTGRRRPLAQLRSARPASPWPAACTLRSKPSTSASATWAR